MNKKHSNGVLNVISDNILEQLIYIMIFALFNVPFLLPNSYYPEGKFYQELFAIFGSTFICIVSVYRSHRVSISSAGIATFLFGIFLLFQVALGYIRIPSVSIDTSIELFAVTALCIGITSFVNDNKDAQKKLVTIIAIAAVVGTSIQAFYGYLQYTGIAENFKSFILYVGSDADNVVGNVGQKNDYVDFITVGLFALSYLFFIRKINLWLYSLGALFYILIVSITTSRIPLAFFMVAFVIAVIFVLVNRNNPETKEQNKRLLMIIVALFVGIFVVEAILPKLLELFAHKTDAGSALTRFGADSIGQSTYRRFYEWYKCIVLFLSHPFFGVGWEQYAREAIYLMLNDPRFSYIPENMALYSHSHNSVLEILAETGIVGFSISVVYGFCYTIYSIFKKFNNYETVFLCFMISTIFVQGLFQFPLWYAYFLVIFILMLSVNKVAFSIQNSKMVKGIFTVAFVVFVVFCISLLQTYNQLLRYSNVPQDMDDYVTNVKQLEQIFETTSFWKLQTLMVLNNYIMPGSPQTSQAMSIEEQLKYVDLMGNQLPYTGSIFNQIVVHKLAGDETKSKFYADLLAHAFPYYKDKIAQQLSQDPRFAPEIEVINNFQYEDRSIFSRYFHGGVQNK